MTHLAFTLWAGIAQALAMDAAASPAHAVQMPGAPMPVIPSPGGPEGGWRIRGDRSIRPARIHDDGVRTYLEWRPDQSLPAVFAIGPTGAEEVVDGYMRAGVFVIDRVHSRLVFRIDRDRAVASRAGTAR